MGTVLSSFVLRSWWTCPAQTRVLSSRCRSVGVTVVTGAVFARSSSVRDSSSEAALSMCNLSKFQY
eukprot:5767225-Amphidinium_carterae.1